jgi:hypothetical protein
MAWPFSGNITGTVDSLPQDLGMVISSFTLVNLEGTAITANVYKIKIGGQPVRIMPSQYSISAGAMYQATNPTVLLPTEVIRVNTSGSCDYDFYIENLKLTDL